MQDLRPPVLVFVYGTLRDGEPNHSLLASARYIGVVRTAPRYTLVDMGSYPALVAGGLSQVVGELYELDTGTLEEVDEYEDHPAFYRRSPVELEDGREVSSYLLPEAMAVGSRVIESGDWGQRARVG